MAEIKIKVSDDIQSFKNMDVLVYDKKRGEFVTKSASELGQEIMKSFEENRQEMINEINSARARYYEQLSRLSTLIDKLISAFKSGGHEDV